MFAVYLVKGSYFKDLDFHCLVPNVNSWIFSLFFYLWYLFTC